MGLLAITLTPNMSLGGELVQQLVVYVGLPLLVYFLSKRMGITPPTLPGPGTQPDPSNVVNILGWLRDFGLTQLVPLLEPLLTGRGKPAEAITEVSKVLSNGALRKPMLKQLYEKQMQWNASDPGRREDFLQMVEKHFGVTIPRGPTPPTTSS